MKLITLLFVLVAALASLHGQTISTRSVITDRNGNLLSDFTVPFGRTVTVGNGGSLTVVAGATVTFADNSLGISTVTGLQSALNAKAPLESPTFTGTVSGITKGMVGLGNVDNTNDASKPVSTAQAAADAAVQAAAATDATTKANAAQAAAVQRANHTGTQLASTISDFAPAAAAAAPVQSVAGRTGAVALAKADVGLGNVDNTSDVAKPISTATQTALDAKAPLASPTFSGTVSVPALTLSGAITAAPTTITTSIDVTKPVNSVTISNSSTTLTYSATPATGTRTELTITNSAAAVHTVAIPSTWSEQRSANITSLSVPANGSLTVGLRREASRWVVIGDPVGIGDLATVASIDPATTYFEAYTTAGSRRILAEDMPSVNLPATATEVELETGTETGLRSFSPALIDNHITLRLADVSVDGASMGDVKFIPAAFDVPAGWSLTGVNGIPAFTTPDADYVGVVKLGGTVSNVTFSVPGGEVDENTELTLSTATPGATIHYTTNGDTPSRSVGTEYSTPIVLTVPVTVRAFPFLDYWADGGVTSETYTIASSVTNLISERFEGAGAPAGWNAESGSIEYDYTTAPAPLAGTESLAINGAFAGAGVSLGASYNEVWGFFHCYPNAGSNNAMFVLRNSSNVAQMSIAFRSDRIRVEHPGGTAGDVLGAAFGQQNVIWFRYVAQSGGGGNGTITFYVNKNSSSTTRPAASFTFTTSTGGSVSNMLFLSQGAGQWIYDDVLVRETEIGSNPF